MTLNFFFFMEFGHRGDDFELLVLGHDHRKAIILRAWNCSRFAMGCNQAQSVLWKDSVLRLFNSALRNVPGKI